MILIQIRRKMKKAIILLVSSLISVSTLFAQTKKGDILGTYLTEEGNAKIKIYLN